MASPLLIVEFYLRRSNRSIFEQTEFRVISTTRKSPKIALLAVAYRLFETNEYSSCSKRQLFERGSYSFIRITLHVYSVQTCHTSHKSSTRRASIIITKRITFQGNSQILSNILPENPFSRYGKKGTRNYRNWIYW